MTTKTKLPSRGEIDRVKYEGQPDDWYKDTSPEAMDMVSEGNAQKQGDHLRAEKARVEQEKRRTGRKDLEATKSNEPDPMKRSDSGSRRDASQDTGPKKRQADGSDAGPRDAQSSN
jgi:hypothetical protein